MHKKLDASASVKLFYNHLSGKVTPLWVSWSGRSYPITKIGMHHHYKKGNTLFHVFSVTTPSLFLRLVLDTSNLHWKIEEIADGMPD